MSLVAPEFGVEIGNPQIYGLVTKYGYSRDWRCDVEWEFRSAEFIQPLKAIAPTAVITPRDMSDTVAPWSDTSSPNDSWREIYPDWSTKALSYQFMDGSKYVPGDLPNCIGSLRSGVWSREILPRFVLYVIRGVGPADQGIPQSVCVSVPSLFRRGDDVWEPGRLTLYLPRVGPAGDPSDQYDTAFLHNVFDSVRPPGEFIDVFNSGAIISQGPKASSAVQGSDREGWLFEYVEDISSFDGGHILIRDLRNPERWWHYWHRQLYLASRSRFESLGIPSGGYGYGGDPPGYSEDGRWWISIQGAVTAVNLTALNYGVCSGVAWPQEDRPLPDEVAANAVEANSWNHASDPWESAASLPTSGWSVETDQEPEGHRPRVTFLRTDDNAWHTRPIVWFSYENHPAVISGSGGSRVGTMGTNYARQITWFWGRNWKGSQGQVELYPDCVEAFPTWRENGDAILSLGWASGAGAGIETTPLAHCYVAQKGLPRRKPGGQVIDRARVTVRLGAFDVVRLPGKTIVDVKQAGAITVGLWASMTANRLGIPATRVYVDPAIQSQVIQLGEYPSAPVLDPGDGSAWSAHIAEVERAANIRVCWNVGLNYDLWVDAGPPAYVPGVSHIALVIDEDTTTLPDFIWDLEHAQTLQQFRNFLKIVYGARDARLEWYFSDTLARRTTTIGDDWPVVMSSDDVGAAGDLWGQFLAEYYRQPDFGVRQSLLAWAMPLRVDLFPDQFVQVVDCNYVGLVANGVYRILTHRLQANAETLDGESMLTAELVFVPAGQGAGFNGQGVNMGGFN